MGVLKQALGALHQYERRVIRRQGVNATDLGTGLDYNIFTVTSGVRIHAMFGHVTTVIGATANLIFLAHTPTVTGVAVPLCAVTATIATDAVDTLYVWPGTIAGQLIPSTNVGQATANLMNWVGNTILLVPGVMSVDVGAAGANTGEIDWYILYEPCFAGAEITVI